MPESSTTTHSALSRPIVSAARLYTSGCGFLRATASPQKKENLAYRSAPICVSTIVRTAASFDVEHTASGTSAAIASSTIASTPGRSGMVPSLIKSMKSAVFRLCISVTSAKRPASTGSPLGFTSEVSATSWRPSGQPWMSK